MDYFAATTSSGSNNNGKQNKVKKTKAPTNGGGSGSGSYCCRLSTDPQSVAARERRHRISDRFKILQSLVPGGSKMDTVSMLEQAINYVKFLKAQILLHQTLITNDSNPHHHVDVEEYRNINQLAHYNHEDPTASFYLLAGLHADSGSPDLAGGSSTADSYSCTHPEVCMFPAPEYFVGQGGGEHGMRYL